MWRYRSFKGITAPQPFDDLRIAYDVSIADQKMDCNGVSLADCGGGSGNAV